MTCLCTVLTSHKFIWFFFSVFSVVVITLLGDHFIPRQLILSCSTLENVSSVLLVLWYPTDNDLCYKLVKNYTCTLCIRLLTYRDDLCSKIVCVVINLRHSLKLVNQVGIKYDLYKQNYKCVTNRYITIRLRNTRDCSWQFLTIWSQIRMQEK